MDGKPVEPTNEDGDIAKKMHELEIEFNAQRGKMRELYMQKEIECKKLMSEFEVVRKELDEAKSQLLIVEYQSENDMQRHDRKAQEEIASLQQLVQETIEESSIYKTELLRLQDEQNKIKQENRELREELSSHQQDSSSLAPVLSHVKKTLARKLGAESGGSHDSLDDSMRKVNKYAQEDAEVLRSLVVPLEEEIKALKEKLRTTDEELQSFRGTTIHRIPSGESSLAIGTTDEMKLSSSSSPQKLTNEQLIDSISKSTSMDYMQCDMCKNYETKLVQSQKLLNEEKENIESLQKILKDAREDLIKEAALRHDLENQWQEKREAHKEEVQYLTNQVRKSDEEMKIFNQKFLDTKEEIHRQLLRLTLDRDKINKHLETLHNDNEYLSGKYLATADELQNQRIDLPNNVEELHELLLKQHDELIQARVGYDFEKRKCVSYEDETEVLRSQLESLNEEFRTKEHKYRSHCKSLETRLKNMLESELHTPKLKEKYEKMESDMKKQLAESGVKIIELQASIEKLEHKNADLNAKCKNLKEELATSEHVQKDFVKLSQSLQIALEKIRQADTQVRWQDNDDIDSCQNCNSKFTVTCRKQHCRHCGTIYCEKCLTKTVPSGPRNKPASVCDICHTLLIPNTAPYFSQAPPQSPN